MPDKKPCGCGDEKKSTGSRNFLYDKTGYNVDAIVEMSEAHFVTHPMHNHNYAHLSEQEKSELLRRIYRLILESAGIELKPSVPLHIVKEAKTKMKMLDENKLFRMTTVEVEANGEAALDECGLIRVQHHYYNKEMIRSLFIEAMVTRNLEYDKIIEFQSDYENYETAQICKQTYEEEFIKVAPIQLPPPAKNQKRIK